MSEAILIGSHDAPSELPTPATVQPMVLVRPLRHAAATAVSDTNSSSSSASFAEEPQSVYISNITHDTVACTVGDQHAFSAAFVAENASLSALLLPIAPTATPTGCYMYDTVDDLHLACARDASCAGFTTIRIDANGLPTEMPLCLYLGAAASSLAGGGLASSAGIGSSTTNAGNDMMIYPRIFYRKDSRKGPAACGVGVAQSGHVAVYIQQTQMATNEAYVSINGALEARCGGTRPFLNGYMGTDGRCGQWALCYAGRVPVGSNISITTRDVPIQGGCDSSLGVLVRQTSIDEVQWIAEPPIPIPRLDVRPPMEHRLVRKRSLHTDAAKIYVFNAHSAALDVSQNSHRCSGGGGNGIIKDDCTAATTIRMGPPASCQTCGGLKGFLGGLRGLSDRPDVDQFCGNFLTLIAGPAAVGPQQCEANGLRPTSGMYGIISVEANVSAMSSLAGGDTDGLVAKLYAPQAESRAPVFPLIDGSNGGFSTLLGAPIAASADRIGEFLSVSPQIASNHVAHVATVGPPNSPIGAFYVPWRTLYGVGLPIQDRLHRNSSQVCVIDHAMEEAARCVFYVPRGSTHMAIRAAQVDFADVTLEVRTLLNGDALSALDRCGGPRAAFGRVMGRQEECETYLTCSNRYLYADDDDAETNSQGIVVVTIPATARSRSCNFVASIIADFSNPLQGPADCDPASAYECPGERRCVPLSYVCDGIQDCEGIADESGCHQLVPLPDEAFCIDAEFYVNSSVSRWQPMEECKRAAARLGSGLFTLEPNTLNCAACFAGRHPQHYDRPRGFCVPHARSPNDHRR